jgi:C4-dicarboxylate-specific signal transduction histidine kinase
VQEIVAAPKPDSWCLAGRVAGGLAHEFNNIFSAISGFAVLAEEDANYVRDLVQTAKEQSRRGERLNLSLLNLVRADYSSTQACEVTPILEELMLLMEHSFRKQGLRLRLLPAATPPVRVNPGRLRRALLQLLFAFSEAMPKEAELCIQTRSSGPAAEVLFSSSPPLASEQLAAIAASAGPETGSEWSGDDNLEVQPEAEQVLVRLPLLNPT